MQSQTDTIFQVTLLSREATRGGQLARGLAELPGRDAARIGLRTFSLAEFPGREQDAREAVAAADLVIASHVLLEEDARAVESLLDAARPGAAILVLASLKPVLKRTRLGEVRFAEPMALIGLAGPAAMSLGRLFMADDMTEALREVRGELPRMLAALPPRAADLAFYLRACLAWAEPSPRNMGHLLLEAVDRYGAKPGALTGRWKEPELHPESGLYHPDCGLVEKRELLPERPDAHARVGLLLMRGAVIAGETEGLDVIIAAFEERGLATVPVFADSFDFRDAIERHGDGCDAWVALSGFPLVGGHNRCDADGAAAFLAARGVPFLTPPALLIQSIDSWKTSRLGLTPMECAMEVAVHELEGGIEPLVVHGADASGRRSALAGRAAHLVGRLSSWLELRRKPNADKRVVLTVFAFPPDKGAVGTAAYLDVMKSTHRILERLAREGYDVEVPDTPEELLARIVSAGDPRAPMPSAELAVGARLGVADYERIAPESRRAERLWGNPPGDLNSDGRDLLIHGVALGNAFVGVQPSFGFEGDPMRLLFEKDATPHHGFIAYYAWARRVFGADAIVHVGTHGALEFMPGKQVGLSGECWPDVLVGETPNVYLYAVNNPSEASIAKRRGYAVTVGHLTPPCDRAGLYHELADMKAMIAEARGAEEPRRRRRTVEALIEMADRHGLTADAPPPADGEDDDGFLGRLWVALEEIEARRIPVGLHIAGRAAGESERVELLGAIAEHDRDAVTGVVTAMARERGLDPDVVRASAGRAEEAATRLVSEAGHLARQTAETLLRDGRDAAAAHLDENGVAGAEELVEFMAAVDDRLSACDELGPLVAALDGRYIPPGPGGDPVRDPGVVPTGRNIHALDPGGVPSEPAVRRARDVVDALLDRHVREEGRYPRSVALVLWGLDNIKTQGEGIAQALLLMGVRPRRNSIGRVAELEIIPLEELGRPRIDVVLTASGIFRDVFGTHLGLLDRAVRLVADLDESPEENFVRSRVLELEEAFGPDRARARVFSNSPGAYGGHVDHMVALSSWEEREDLARMFALRKGYVFGENVEGERATDVLEALAAGVEATFQNVDSSEVSITDVDHYFEYLGGMTALVESKAGKRPPARVADATTAVVRVRALDEAVRLEARTKLLNPKWYEGMLAHGFEGAEEIRKRVDYTFGWSATCEAVDEWIYREVCRTFVTDDDVSGRMSDANPHSWSALVDRLLEADARGFWNPTDDERAAMRAASDATDDAIEGVAPA